MSAQPTPIIIGPRGGQSVASPGTGDFQRIADNVLSALSRRRWLFVLPTLLGLLTTLAFSLFLPRRYETRAIFERRDDPVLANIVRNKQQFNFASQRATLERDLIGQAALVPTLEDLNMLPTPTRDDTGLLTPQARAEVSRIANLVLSGVEVRAIPKSEELDVITVSYSGSHPELAAPVMNGLVERYIDEVQHRIMDAYRDSRMFYASQAEEKNKELTELRGQLSQMASDHPGIDSARLSELDDLLASENQRVLDLDRRRAEISEKIAAWEADLADLDLRFAFNSSSGDLEDTAGSFLKKNPHRIELAKQIDSVNLKIADMRANKMKDAHPELDKQLGLLERLQIQFESEPEHMEENQQIASALEPTDHAQKLLSIGAERRRLERYISRDQRELSARESELIESRAKIAQYSEALKMLPQRRLEYAKHQQQLKRLESGFAAWSGQIDLLDQVITAESKNRGIHYSMASGASIPRVPFSPTIGSLFIMAAIIGLGLGAGSVVISEFLDRSFKDVHRVKQSLGIPVLETIGEIRQIPTSGAMMRAVALNGVAGLQAILVITAGTLLYMSLYHPRVYEQFLASATSLWSW